MTPTTRPIIINLCDRHGDILDWDVFRPRWTLANASVFGVKELDPKHIAVGTVAFDEYFLRGLEL